MGGGADGGSGGSGAGAGSGGGGFGGVPGDWTPPIGIPIPEFGIEEDVDSCDGCRQVSATSESDLQNIPAGTIVQIDA